MPSNCDQTQTFPYTDFVSNRKCTEVCLPNKVWGGIQSQAPRGGRNHQNREEGLQTARIRPSWPPASQWQTTGCLITLGGGSGGFRVKRNAQASEEPKKGTKHEGSSPQQAESDQSVCFQIVLAPHRQPLRKTKSIHITKHDASPALELELIGEAGVWMRQPGHVPQSR